MNSFISSDNTWMLWTFLVVWSAISIVLEQKYKWASKVTGAIIALLGAIIFANLKIIPTESSVYDSVWTYVVPVAIPLLLLKADIKKVKNESGKMLGAFILVFCLLAVFIHLFITLIIDKMFKFKLDKLLLASNVCIGEPTTAIAMSIA